MSVNPPRSSELAPPSGSCTKRSRFTSLSIAGSLLFAGVALLAAESHAQSRVDVPRLDLASINQLVPASDPFAWKMKKASWSAQDESEFSEFVQKIGSAVEKKKCNRVDNCMASDANPFRGSDPAGFRYYADCADLPGFLRGYFAWKKGLPFSFVSQIRARNANDPKLDDLRYTRDGNKPALRTDTVASSGFPHAGYLINSHLINSVSTAMMRTPIAPPASEAVSDFYAIPVNRAAVKPGTVIYSGDGHVAVVYKIEADGVIKVIDAHPDNSLTLNVYGSRFVRSRSEQGAIFKNFRPLDVVGAKPDSAGNLIGGKIVVKDDREIAGVSYEQAETKFPSSSSYLMWVRKRMASMAFKINVVTEFKKSLENLCNLVGQRAESVKVAIDAGMDQKEHVERMPKNIYGAEGDWETYSTPGRDVSLRMYFKSALDNVKESVQGFQSGSKDYEYSGQNLAQDLYDTYAQVSMSCPLKYVGRDGQSRSLDLEQIRTRLFQISFDPYHCIDLRWGDVATGNRVCGEDLRWYSAQQYLRNMTVRNLEERHDFNLTELEAENTRRLRDVVWDTNFIQYFTNLGRGRVR